MIVEESEVSLVANSFISQRNPCGKSLMQTRKRRMLNIEPFGTSASTRDHLDD